MATNIGPKIGIEGAADYRKQMSQIITQAKELDSEMRLVTSSFDKETSAEDKAAAKAAVLSKQMENQKQRVDLLRKEVEKATEAYGENDARTMKLKTTMNNAETVLNNMGKEMNELETETRQSTVELNNFDKALNFGIAHLPSMESLAKGAATAIGTTLAAAAAAAATAITAVTGAIIKGGQAMVEWAQEAGEFSDKIQELAAITGMSNEELQELSYMADLLDVDLNTIAGAMAKTTKSMQKVKEGNADAVEAFNTLGIVVTGAGNKLLDNEEVFWKVIDALGKIENETERDALAMTIFGKSAQQLNPLIQKGSKEVKKFAEEAHKAGAVMDDETIEQLGDMDDSFKKLKSGATAAKRALGAALSPQLTKLADGVTGALGNFSNAVLDADGDTDKLSEAFSTLISDLTTLIIDNMPEIISFAADLIGAIATAFGENPDKIAEAAGALADALVDGVTQNAGPFTTVALEVIAAVFNELVKEENLLKIKDAGQDVIVALGNGISDHIDEIFGAVTTLLETIRDSLKDQESRQEFVDAATNFIKSFANALADHMDVLADIAPELAIAITEVLTDPEVLLAFANASAEAAVAFWTSFAINSALMPVKIAGTIKKNATSDEEKQESQKAGEGLADEVAKGINKGSDRIGQEAEQAADKALGKVEGVEGDMETSGEDMMGGLARGIAQKGRQVIAAAQEVANRVRALLHFSRPDEGPLRDYETWMPDFMAGLAKGIDRNAWRVRDAVAGLSSDMTLSLSPSADPSGASYTNMTTNVGGITVQVYGAEGQSVDALADRVMDKINVTLQNSGRVWA